MTNIPQNTVTMEDLAQWDHLQQELKRVKAAEMLLRTKIFNGLFTAPKEGTNSIPLNAGYVLKGTYVLNRTIDIGALQAIGDKMAELGIHKDDLVKYKPELVIGEYRTLTDEQRQLFDQALVIKPGSPALEIVLPKKRGSAGEKE